METKINEENKAGYYARVARAKIVVADSHNCVCIVDTPSVKMAKRGE